jgi:mannose-1-phosphate guanylyltransferase
LEAVSLDKGIMEKADNLLVFAADIGWSDVGSWTSMRDFIVPDDTGNIAQGTTSAWKRATTPSTLGRDWSSPSGLTI